MKDKLALLKEKVYQLMQVTVSGFERAIGFRHVFLRFLKEERRLRLQAAIRHAIRCRLAFHNEVVCVTNGATTTI